MRRFMQTALLVVFVCIPGMALGQVSGSVSAGLSLPTGDYADDIGNDAGFATTGATVLAQLSTPISTAENLAWIGTAGITSHGVDDEVADILVGAGAVNVDVGRYWGVPVLTGLRYDIPISEMAAIFGTGQLGVVFAKGPTIEASGQTATYNVATTLGFAVGGGVQFNPRFGIGMRYLPLGDIEAEVEFDSGASTEVEAPVSYLDIYGSFTIP